MKPTHVKSLRSLGGEFPQAVDVRGITAEVLRLRVKGGGWRSQSLKSKTSNKPKD